MTHATTPAERRVLSGLLDNAANAALPSVLNLAGIHFTDAAVGDVFERMFRAILSGEAIDSVWVSNLLTTDKELGRGFDGTEPFEWSNDIMIPQSLVHEAAVRVRADATRRGLVTVQHAIGNALAEGGDPAIVAADAVRWTSEVASSSPSRDGLTAQSLGDLLMQEDEYDWVIPDLLERQDRLVLTGTEGVGKSTFARQLCILAAAGIHPLTYRHIPPVKVLAVDAENTERQWRRYVRYLAWDAAQQGVADPRENVFVFAGKRLDLTTGPHLAEIHKLIQHHKPDLLYIGPFYKLVSKGIYTDDDAAPIIAALDGLREQGVALVMEAHASKSHGKDGRRSLEPRGSSQLLGWPEFGFGMMQDDDDPDLAHVIRWRGDREVGRGWPTKMYRSKPWPWADASAPQDPDPNGD